MTRTDLLAAAEPALLGTLGLGGTLLNSAVELVGGLESLGLGILCGGLDVALVPAGLIVGLGNL